jgi:hypothetical protein
MSFWVIFRPVRIRSSIRTTAMSALITICPAGIVSSPLALLSVGMAPVEARCGS